METKQINSMKSPNHNYKMAEYAPMRINRDTKPSYYESFIELFKRLLKHIKAL